MTCSASASGITLTCKSDSAKEAYPQNAGSNFTVKLSQPLRYSTQSLNEEPRWEVAPLSLHYTNSLESFREDCTIYAIIEHWITDPTEFPLRNVNTRVRLAVADIPGFVESDPPPLLLALVRRFFDDNPNVPEAHYGMFRLPAKVYTCTADACKDVVDQFNKLFMPYYETQELRIGLSEGGYVRFYLANGRVLSMYSDTRYIATVFGLRSVEIDVEYDQQQVGAVVLSHLNTAALGLSPTQTGTTYESVTMKRTKLFKLDMIGTETPKFDRGQAVYVYTDLVDDQYVGSMLAPLIAYVGSKGLPGERVEHTFSPLVYLPVCRHFIDDVRVWIRDEHGDKVSFPDDAANVVLRLLFRKSSL